MKMVFHFLENGIHKTVTVQTEKEQIEFYQKARKENLSIFRVENLEKKKGE